MTTTATITATHTADTETSPIGLRLDRVIRMLCKPFTYYRSGQCLIRVDAEGTVRVYDSVEWTVQEA